MANKEAVIGRKRLYIGRFYIVLPGLMLIGSAIAKFSVPKVITEMGAMGFDGNRLAFIAVLEIVCAVLFLVPATRSFGLLMLSAYLGGAIATHLQHGQSMLQPCIPLAMAWFGTYLRNPQALWSFTGTPAATTASAPYRSSAVQGA